MAKWRHFNTGIMISYTASHSRVFFEYCSMTMYLPALILHSRSTKRHTYGGELRVLGDAILPGKAEDVGQIEGEVNDAAAGGRQVGFVEEHAHQETLHDGGDGESQQEEEDEDGVTVI